MVVMNCFLDPETRGFLYTITKSTSKINDFQLIVSYNKSITPI